ncbi:MAG TPA: hypothetical protein VGJ40_07575 [Gaiellaceae bacterium]
MIGLFLDQVHFEVADYAAAERLTRRLAQTRTAGLLGGEPYVVAAALSSEAHDLAVLLRDVEAWVEEESLYAIRFMLDGRIYVITAGATDWSSPPWAVPVEEVEESPRAA